MKKKTTKKKILDEEIKIDVPVTTWQVHYIYQVFKGAPLSSGYYQLDAKIFNGESPFRESNFQKMSKGINQKLTKKYDRLPVYLCITSIIPIYEGI